MLSHTIRGRRCVQICIFVEMQRCAEISEEVKVQMKLKLFSASFHRCNEMLENVVFVRFQVHFHQQVTDNSSGNCAIYSESMFLRFGTTPSLFVLFYALMHMYYKQGGLQEGLTVCVWSVGQGDAITRWRIEAMYSQSLIHTSGEQSNVFSPVAVCPVV